MPRNGIMMFRAYMEAAEALAEDSKAAAYDYLHAILKYALDEEEPELKGGAKSAFMLTKLPLETSIQRSASGKAGGEKKQISSKSQANLKQNESIPKANLKQNGSIPKANAKPTETKEEIRNKKEERRNKKEETPPYSPPTGADGFGDPFPNEPPAPKEPSVYEERFGRFWEAYPKKIGKGAARNSFIKLKPSEALTEKMLGAIAKAKQTAQWQKDRGQYIPNPATWLNQSRWEDGYEGNVTIVRDYGTGSLDDWKDI